MKTVMYERTVFHKSGSLAVIIPRHICDMLDIVPSEPLQFHISCTGLISLYSVNEPKRSTR